MRDSWDRYGRALEAHDGAAAAAVVSSNSWVIYERQRKLALTATEEELRAATPFDQLAALILRAELKPAKLRSATPQELFAFAIDRGMINEASGTQIRLGEVTTDGDLAFAELVYLGRETETPFTFRLEGGAWKLDLVPLSQMGESELRGKAMSEGKTVDEFVDLLMEQLLGRAKARGIWTPIDKA